MAYKQFALDERTLVTIYKRKASRNLRLSIKPDGSVRVSIPRWAPYKAGVDFARSRMGWIQSQRQPARLLSDKQPVGKAHRLRFEAVSSAGKVSSRVRQNEVIIYHPEGLSLVHPDVQKRAETASLRALRLQAEALLPGRLADLASQHDFSYQQVTIKHMKSRWGSCDARKNIVLNLFLMQLPWDCIDYVLLHELTHTRVLKHGPEFWSAMEAVLPNVKRLRKIMRDHQPVLHASEALVA